MKFHPYSEVFPLLLETEFVDLANDIKAHGQREKIWLYDGKILDGRNRFLACQRAKVKPQYRVFKGNDAAALALVVSANIRRRQLSESQLAFAGARIAEIQHGGDRKSEDFKTARAALISSQAEIAEKIGTSPDSIQRAGKVLEKGSAALQKAAEKGDVSLRKAASVVNLPKAEQLAATAKPERADDDDEGAEAELAKIEAIEKEYTRSIEKVMAADDKLAVAHAEIKRQAAEIASLKISRDGFMNGKTEITRLLGKEQNKNERLVKEVERLTRENQQLKQRAA